MASASSCPGCGGHLRLEDAQGGPAMPIPGAGCFPERKPRPHREVGSNGVTSTSAPCTLRGVLALPPALFFHPFQTFYCFISEQPVVFGRI